MNRRPANFGCIVLKFLLLLLVVALAGGYLYYQNFVGSPKYSLLQAHKAMENHDMEAFEKYVDVPSVTGSLIDQLAEAFKRGGITD